MINACINTSIGPICVLLFDDDAPLAVRSFLHLISLKFFDETEVLAEDYSLIAIGPSKGRSRKSMSAPNWFPYKSHKVSYPFKDEPSVGHAPGPGMLWTIHDYMQDSNGRGFRIAGSGARYEEHASGGTIFGQVVSDADLAIVDTIIKSRPISYWSNLKTNIMIRDIKIGTIFNIQGTEMRRGENQVPSREGNEKPKLVHLYPVSLVIFIISWLLSSVFPFKGRLTGWSLELVIALIFSLNGIMFLFIWLPWMFSSRKFDESQLGDRDLAHIRNIRIAISFFFSVIIIFSVLLAQYSWSIAEESFPLPEPTWKYWFFAFLMSTLCQFLAFLGLILSFAMIYQRRLLRFNQTR
nr:peptidylprolyl isomerase [Candidatus Sigynarchaeum springense]MDO8116577.1 peptidylprolyl isomerase [Candidatus Sigynarchaeota archaeon]